MSEPPLHSPPKKIYDNPLSCKADMMSDIEKKGWKNLMENIVFR